MVLYDVGDEIYRRVGERIREARRQQNMTQGELGERVGLSTAAISEIERGVVRTSLSNLERLARALGVSLEHLLRDDGGTDRQP